MENNETVTVKQKTFSEIAPSILKSINVWMDKHPQKPFCDGNETF